MTSIQKNTIVLSAVVTVLITSLLTFLACGNNNPKNSKDTGGIIKANTSVPIPTKFQFTYDNPTQPFIQSVVPVPEEAKQAVIRGIEKQIQITKIKFPQWNFFRNVSDYNVTFIEPMAINQDGSPALLAYGVTQTAGTIIGIPTVDGIIGDGINPPHIVLPHQANQNWLYLEYLEDSAWFESEHFAELQDISEFKKYVGTNDKHPHHQPPNNDNQSKGFIKN